MSFLDRRGFRLGFATLVLFTGIAGDFWRNLLTWWGWGAIVALIVAGSVVVLVHNRRRFSFTRLPYPLIAFLGLCALSIAWSFYRWPSAGGTVSQIVTSAAAIAIVVTLSWAELLVALGWVFRLILGMSFIFEFIVAAFFRHPIYPVWLVPDDPAHPAALLYWSRDLLFSAGKIQGIVGNSSLLAMAALLGLIVFVIQSLTRSVGRFWGFFWILVAGVTIALTKSATIFVALAAVIVVAAAAALVQHATRPRARAAAYGGIVVAVVGLAALAFALRGPLLKLLGKSPELTGRTHIWDRVIFFAEQRPAFGWGWISYWLPNIAPFNHLAKAGGVQVLHAHDAWLDVWLQLGIVGLVVFGALTLSTLVRSWLLATDRTITAPNTQGTFTVLAMLPLLMFTAQLIQSIAESRMLLEGGWMLLVIWAVKTKWHNSVEAPPPVRSRLPEVERARIPV
jgi:exopolysaccharide production protein ExoQ